MSLFRAVYIGTDNRPHGMTFAAADPQAGLTFAERIAPGPVLTLAAVKSRAIEFPAASQKGGSNGRT